MNKYLTIAALLIAGTASAQRQPLELPRMRTTVQEVFRLIRSQTGFGVAYNASHIDAQRTLVLPANSLTLEQALASIDSQIGTRHQYNGQMILFSQRPPETTPRPALAAPSPATIPADRSEAIAAAPAPPRRSEPDPVVLEEEPEPVSSWRESDDYTASLEALPHVGLKTNLLYGLGTLTPNLSLEIGLGRRTTLEFGGSYHPWRRKGSLASNRKLVHMILRSEFRYWFCERFNGHFLGAHLLFSRYNIGSHDVPLLFDRKYRYDGLAYGGGVSYGYNWMLGKRWNLELTAGLGVMRLKYDRYDCAACNRNSVRGAKTYFGLTNAGVSLVFLIK